MKHISLSFSRMNPPTRGHIALAEELEVIGEDGAYVILSKSVDKKNPLEYNEKVELCKDALRSTKVEVLDSPARHVYEAVQAVYEKLKADGVDTLDTTLHIVCGSDRKESYERIKSYNGKEQQYFFEFADVEVDSMDRDDTDEGISGFSASKVRAAAISNDYEYFLKATDFSEPKEVYDLLRARLALYYEVANNIDEADQRLNSHGMHFEDAVLFGTAGIEELRGHIKSIGYILDNKSVHDDDTFTVKIDGAPAVVCFSNFYNLNGPAICLKSFMTSAEPKCLYSNEEIDAKYGDRPDMAEKLKYALQLASYIPEGEAWQGDILFSKSTLFTKDGDIAFQPNKIVYAVDPESETGKKISEAEFGIAFHTRYIGESKRQSFKISASTLDTPDYLFVMDANVQPVLDGSLDDGSKKLLNDALEELEVAISTLEMLGQEYEDLCANSRFMDFFFKTYQNKITSDNATNYIDEEDFLTGLSNYCTDKINKEYGKKTFKTDRGAANNKVKWDAELESIQDLIENNSELLTWIVHALNAAVGIKDVFMKATEKTGTSFKKYYRLENGYEDAADEGFALGDKDGNYVKIVNRSVFSNRNRDTRYLSGFQHENIEEGLSLDDPKVIDAREKSRSILEEFLTGLNTDLTPFLENGDLKVVSQLEATESSDFNGFFFSAATSAYKKSAICVIKDTPADQLLDKIINKEIESAYEYDIEVADKLVRIIFNKKRVTLYRTTLVLGYSISTDIQEALYAAFLCNKEDSEAIIRKAYESPLFKQEVDKLYGSANVLIDTVITSKWIDSFEKAAALNYEDIKQVAIGYDGSFSNMKVYSKLYSNLSDPSLIEDLIIGKYACQKDLINKADIYIVADEAALNKDQVKELINKVLNKDAEAAIELAKLGIFGLSLKKLGKEAHLSQTFTGTEDSSSAVSEDLFNWDIIHDIDYVDGGYNPVKTSKEGTLSFSVAIPLTSEGAKVFNVPEEIKEAGLTLSVRPYNGVGLNSCTIEMRAARAKAAFGKCISLVKENNIIKDGIEFLTELIDGNIVESDWKDHDSEESIKKDLPEELINSNNFSAIVKITSTKFIAQAIAAWLNLNSGSNKEKVAKFIAACAGYLYKGEKVLSQCPYIKLS